MKASYHNPREAARWKLTDKEWAELSPLLVTSSKKVHPGRPVSVDGRRAAEVCLFRYHHSLVRNRAFGWNEVPKFFKASPATLTRRFRMCTENGSWSRFWHAANKLRSPRTPLRPVKATAPAIIGELESAYAFFNQQLFANALPVEVHSIARTPYCTFSITNLAGMISCTVDAAAEPANTERDANTNRLTRCRKIWLVPRYGSKTQGDRSRRP
jgi:transposase